MCQYCAPGNLCPYPDTQYSPLIRGEYEYGWAVGGGLTGIGRGRYRYFCQDFLFFAFLGLFRRLRRGGSVAHYACAVPVSRAPQVRRKH